MSGLLKWSFLFLIIAGVAAIFGFGGVAEDAAGIAKVLFFLFLAVFVIMAVLGVTIFKSVT